MKTLSNGVNVAPRSSSGHFVKKAQVVNLDETQEIYSCNVDEGETATLETSNHGEITLKEDFTVFTQNAYNPFSKEITKQLD